MATGSPRMRLAEDEARARLAAHDHGILCTVHAARGVDAVPVVYTVDDDGYLGVVRSDLVKPKASLRLQREANLEADPRGMLLVGAPGTAMTGHGSGGWGPSCAGSARHPTGRPRSPPGWPSATRSTATSPSRGCSCCASSV